MERHKTRQFAVVTGASSGIGLELAHSVLRITLTYLVAADEPDIADAARQLGIRGATVAAVQCDLATKEGVEGLCEAIAASNRPVDALIANAGRGLGHAFLEQNLEEAMRVVHTNIDGIIRLIIELGEACVTVAGAGFSLSAPSRG